MEERRIPFDLDAYVAEVTSGRECFVCRIVREPEPEHPVIFQDEACIAFLNRYPPLLGYTIVAPVAHKERVVEDFDLASYLALQGLIHRLGRAISMVVPTERLYVLSLGSKQGNSHVHWHLAPLPPGVPFQEQQFAALMVERQGFIQQSVDERSELALRIRLAYDEMS
ncbi:MAG TPA: HIT family protein [Acidimicrobiales bacterium]|nr:HIT family protein [Acidimicrobiales bacterium]